MRSNRKLLQTFGAAVFLLNFALTAVFCATARAQTAGVAAPQKLRVLFIGNSYTYVNDLPAIVDQFFRARSTPYEYEAVTVGGATLEKHWKDNHALAAVRSRSERWNYVILQEQSTRPFQNREAFLRYAKLFDYEIRRTGAKTVLYMTWNAKANPAEQPKLTEAYQTAGQNMGAVVVPVGPAWAKATAAGFDLYSSDGRHPNGRGSYLAACLFYRVLSGGKSPIGLPLGFTRAGKPASELSETQALALQRIADAIFY